MLSLLRAPTDSGRPEAGQELMEKTYRDLYWQSPDRLRLYARVYDIRGHSISSLLSMPPP